MAGISDFVTMKLLENEHLHERGISNLDAWTGLMPKATRNLAIRVLAPEMARLDAVIAVLGVSKQEFMLELLRDGLERTLKVFEERGWMDAFDATFREELHKLGLREVDQGDGTYRLEGLGEIIEETGGAE